jgi:hypothetical protein
MAPRNVSMVMTRTRVSDKISGFCLMCLVREFGDGIGEEAP